MSKIITFSRTYPSYHPKAGQLTYFVEKIYKSLYLMKSVPAELQDSFNFSIMNNDLIGAKHHTIRAGHRWKVGDRFSPRVWSGQPYYSKQIIIAPDIEIKKTWDIEIVTELTIKHFSKLFETTFYMKSDHDIDVKKVAQNDGLEVDDFLYWFHKPKQQIFSGQIICWNESILY